MIVVLFFLCVSYLGSQTRPNQDYDLTDLEDTSVSSQISKYLSGYGQEATESFYLQKGLARFQMKHSGSRNFVIWLMDSSGNNEELLVNEIGSFDGSKAVRIPSSGYYLLDVDASGSWSVSIS
jgi:hypothetical protein